MKNNRLGALGYNWAFTAAARPVTRPASTISAGPAAMAIPPRCDLFNRMLGQLHHCLHNGVTYDPAKAFPNAVSELPTEAAA